MFDSGYGNTGFVDDGSLVVAETVDGCLTRRCLRLAWLKVGVIELTSFQLNTQSRSDWGRSGALLDMLKVEV